VPIEALPEGKPDEARQGLTAGPTARGGALALAYTQCGWLSTLLRHWPVLASPAPLISRLALGVVPPAARSRLIPPVRGPLAVSAGRACAGRAAVPVPAVAMPTDDNLRVAAVAGEEPLGGAVVSCGTLLTSCHAGNSTAVPSPHGPPCPPPAALRAG